MKRKKKTNNFVKNNHNFKRIAIYLIELWVLNKSCGSEMKCDLCWSWWWWWQWMTTGQIYIRNAYENEWYKTALRNVKYNLLCNFAKSGSCFMRCLLFIINVGNMQLDVLGKWFRSQVINLDVSRFAQKFFHIWKIICYL